MATIPVDKVTQLQKSLEAYKGHFTRAFTSAEKLCNTLTLHPELLSDLHFQSIIDNIRHTQGLVTTHLEQLYDLDPDDTFLAGLEETSTRGHDAISQLVATKHKLTAHLRQQQQQQLQPDQQMSNQVAPTKACDNDALKPFTLTAEHNPEELRGWKK